MNGIGVHRLYVLELVFSYLGYTLHLSKAATGLPSVNVFHGTADQTLPMRCLKYLVEIYYNNLVVKKVYGGRRVEELIAFFESNHTLLEGLYFISGILLVIGIVIATIQVGLSKRDARERSKRAAVEKSLEYLTFYANSFIPRTDEYKMKLKSEISNPVNDDYLFNGKFLIDPGKLEREILAETIVRQRLRVHDFLNQMEYFGVAVLNGIPDENILYTPLAKHFCEFIKDNHVILSVMRHNGVPYKNLIQLYHKWTKRMEYDKARLQKNEAKHKMKETKEAAKSTKSIGA